MNVVGQPSFGSHVWTLVLKEFVSEGRAGVRLNALLPFALLVLLLFSLAVGPSPHLLRRLAPSLLWLALLFSSTLSLAQAQHEEDSHGAQEGLRLLGVSAEALFVAKALANTLFLSALAVILMPIAVALYDAPIAGSKAALGATMVLGAGGICAPGTLFAALTQHARNKDMLLPLLLFPILVPGLLAAVRLSTLIVQGDPMQEATGWFALLLIFNLVYWILGTLLFDRVLEG